MVNFCAIASAQIWMSSPAAAPDDRCAEDAAVCGGDDLYMAFGLPLGLGAVVLAVGPAQHIDLAGCLHGFGFAQTDVGELGVGEGHARNEARVELGGLAEQGAADDDIGLALGDIGERRRARHVANGKDAAVGRLEFGVDLDALVVVADAGRLQPEIGDRRLAPCRDQQMTAFDDAAFAADRDMGAHSAEAAFDALDLHSGVDVHAFRRELCEHDTC